MTNRRTIAVLGSNSFSGADFIDLLLEDPRNSVVGVSRSPEKSCLYAPYRRRPGRRFEFHRMDLNRDCARLMRLLDGVAPGYVVNFAAQSEVAPSWEHPEHWFQTNTVALASFINELSRREYLARYVHISSPEVYGTCSGAVREDARLSPSTPYAASKAGADLLLAAFARTLGLPLITIRATNIYGPHQQLWKIIPRTAIYLKLGKRIKLHGGGSAIKSFIHIRDVSRGELAAMRQGIVGETYHLSPWPGNRGYRVHELV